MLQKIHIQNYAIIEEITVLFHQHLTALTGETGAGKSIIMGALGLILGDRADTGILIDKGKKCVVEASFLTQKMLAVNEFLKVNDFDIEASTIIRREIAASGKSRAFINDTPTTLQQLQQLTVHLVDLHRQNDTKELVASGFQFEVIDSFSENKQTLSVYKQALSAYRQTFQKLTTAKAALQEALASSDYNAFLLEELDAIKLKSGELEDLDLQLKAAEHSAEVLETMASAKNMLEEAEPSILAMLKKIATELERSGKYYAALAPLSERMSSMAIEAQDIASGLDSANSNMENSEVDVDALRTRLDEGFRLLKKHNATDTDQLLVIKENLRGNAASHQQLEYQVEDLQHELEQQENKLKEFAASLSKNRKKIIPKFEQEVNELLKRVGMPNSRLQVQLATAKDYNSHGLDEVDMLLDANNTGNFLPLYKSASGGELSRIMLSIKSLTATNLELPTLIFDEVDSAISGEAAEQVAMLMRQLAEEHQVITITHQAQTAAVATEHMYIYKEQNAEGRIATKIKAMTGTAREQAIAQMIGGSKPTAAALANARELLDR